jgi:hypothetical protein
MNYMVKIEVGKRYKFQLAPGAEFLTTAKHNEDSIFVTNENNGRVGDMTGPFTAIVESIDIFGEDGLYKTIRIFQKSIRKC